MNRNLLDTTLIRCGWAVALTVSMICASPSIRAQSGTDEPEIRQIIKEIDELYRSETSYAEMEMEIVTPHWQRTLAMKVWTMGMDKTFIRITAPRKEEGVGTLRIGNEMWNYLPKTNKVIKVPPSMMMSSWMGSDFTNDDLVDEFTLLEDYTFERTSVEEPDEELIYIKCTPRKDLPVVWGHTIIAVRADSHLPVWEAYYDEKNRLMRTLEFRDVREFGSRSIPAVMEMKPERKEGHRTVIRYRSIEFDTDIGENIFSLRNLRAKD